MVSYILHSMNISISIFPWIFWICILISMYGYSVLRIYKKKKKKKRNQPEYYRKKPDYLFLDSYTLNVFLYRVLWSWYFPIKHEKAGLLSIDCISHLFLFCFSNLMKHNNYYIFDHCTETYLTVKQVIHQNWWTGWGSCK